MISFFKQLFQKNNGEVEQALQAGAVIIDVRSRSEYEGGHVAGSKNIPLNEIQSKTEMIRSWQKPVITVCRSGARSEAAKGILRAAGIKVYNAGAWTNLPG